MGLLAAIAGLAAPMWSRILVSMGMAVVTIAGANLVVGLLKSKLMNYLAGAPADGLAIAGLAGVWIGLQMVLGSITFTVTLFGLTKTVKMAAA